jgi:hypothetical protein
VGSTLILAYAQRFPERVTEIVIPGVALATQVFADEELLLAPP